MNWDTRLSPDLTTLKNNSVTLVPKRKYQSEDERDDGYADVECPECGAPINAHFQRGRNWRKLECPVCRRSVTVSIEREQAPLVQLERADAE